MMTKSENTEELVFNAVQEYLSDNRVLEKDNLLNFIKSYFSKNSMNINSEGIVKSLESLIKKKRIVEGSRLTKDSILNNEKRKKIYNLIKKNPGLYFNEILKKVSSSNHVVYWHINMLLKFGLIKTTKIQNHEIYYPQTIDEEQSKREYFKRKKECRNILNYLEKNTSGVLKSELAEKLEMHPQTIKKYIKYLEKYGFIEEEKYSPKEVLYFKK
ncbi:MAG: winged helix-turn-helix transcriptional regulator [Promethearchaeota archaeon]|nr:MAG: winged helix-turn-helix transcriptional regulator [Candidatus Lokiarchaeota archaeon]